MQQVAQQKSDPYSFDNRLMPGSAVNVQLMAQPSAPQAASMPSANFDPQQQVGSFSNKMSDYQAPKQVVNPTGSDTPLLDKNQKTFFDMPKSPVTPDGYQWDDNALQNYGFQGAELDRAKTADFSNPDTVNYYVSQGWLRKNDPQSIEEVLSTPSGGTNAGYSGGSDNSFTPSAVAQPANESPMGGAAPQDVGALPPDTNGESPSNSVSHEDVLAEMRRRYGEDKVQDPYWQSAYYDAGYNSVYNDLADAIRQKEESQSPYYTTGYYG